MKIGTDNNKNLLSFRLISFNFFFSVFLFSWKINKLPNIIKLFWFRWERWIFVDNYLLCLFFIARTYFVGRVQYVLLSVILVFSEMAFFLLSESYLAIKWLRLSFFLEATLFLFCLWNKGKLLTFSLNAVMLHIFSHFEQMRKV